MAESTGKSFLFSFPIMDEHITPSFPVARALTSAGHKVTYICRESMKPAIEGTGAVFENEIEVCTELYKDRQPDAMGVGASEALMKELGLEMNMVGGATLRQVHMDLKLPGLLRWIKEHKPAAVLFCPLICREAGWAAKRAGIPSVGLLTVAGPGVVPLALAGQLEGEGMTPEDFMKKVNDTTLRKEKIESINKQYQLDLPVEETFGKLEVARVSYVTLVTTADEFQVEVQDDLAAAYLKDGSKFEGVGPLTEASKEDVKLDEKAENLVAEVRKARSSGRKVVLVSMGQEITGDSAELGWEGRTTGADGKQQGLTGRETCRAAWGAAFDAVGKSRGFVGPLIVVALGPKENALGDLEAPANATCLPIIPESEILKAGVDVFVTTGVQRFEEALTSGVPLVVCPGTGDEMVAAAKAEQLGVGVEVARPDAETGKEAAAADKYREDIAAALQKILGEEKYAKTAGELGARLADVGGVPRVVQRLNDAIAGTAYKRAQQALFAQIQQPNRDDMVSAIKGSGGRSMLNEKLYQRQKKIVLAHINQPARGKKLDAIIEAGGRPTVKK